MAAAATLMSIPALSQQPPFFTSGNTPSNVVVAASGCGVYQGTTATCAIAGGNGNGVGNSTLGGYGDNQGSPLTLLQFAPSGSTNATLSVSYVNSLVLPQAGSGADFPVSAEYGSSSEGTLQLSTNGQFLTIGGYGIPAAAYNASPLTYTPYPVAYSKAQALAQSGSQTGQSYTPVPRVVALIDPSGNVNTSTALYNIFNTNNIRSAFTANGSSVYVSGQGQTAATTTPFGSSLDATGGVFYSATGTANTTPTSITGADAGSGESQETNDVQILTNAASAFNNTLLVSSDSKEGSTNRDYIGTLGTAGTLPVSVANSSNGPTQLTGFAASNGKGAITITSATSNGINSNGQAVNVSPQNYFFASPSVLYVADSGSPKNTSGSTSSLGDGGLQKWVNSQANGSGTWSLKYTLASGLSLVPNSNSSGTTGLYALAGQVVGSNVYLYATNYTIADLDPTYLFGIIDPLSATTNPGASFTTLATAPADSNFKGVSLVPTAPAGAVEIKTAPAGLTVTSSGTGCAPGTNVTPAMLNWTPGSSCQLSVVSPQTSNGVSYYFAKWGDGTTATTDSISAPPSTSTSIYTYTAEFAGDVTGEVSATGSGLVYSRGTREYTGTETITNTSSVTISGPIEVVLANLVSGATLVNATGTVPSGLPYAGSPYITSSASSLAPGASVSVPVQFTYTGSAPISATTKTLSGSL